LSGRRRSRRQTAHSTSPSGTDESGAYGARAPAPTSIGTLALFAAAVGCVYFGLFNHDFSVNGLRYADDVERGIDLFHPNHLLPNFLYRAAYVCAQWLGATNLRAIWLMQAINVCAGIVAAAAVVRVASLRAPRGKAMLIGALYAAGFAAWNFAEEPDVYVLPAAAVALSLALLAARESLSWRAICGLGLLAVLAVLTLQQYVLWYPALLALVARRELGQARTEKMLVLAIGIPLACLLTYVGVGLALDRFQDSNDVLGWFLGYAWNSASGFGTYREAPELPARLLGVVLGLANLGVAYEVIRTKLAFVVAALALLSLAWLVVQSGVRLRRAADPVRSDARIVAFWCVANLAFAAWWESRNIEFLFPLWLGAMMLSALAAGMLDRRLLIAAVVLVAGVNLAVAFWPQRELPERYRVASELARHERLAGDVLITEELNTIGYLHYFERIDVRFQPGAVSAAMHAALPMAEARKSIDAALASGARVFTTEIDERGRLRDLATRFAPLGRRGFDGAVEQDIDTLYRGLDVSSVPVPGVRRVLPATAHTDH